jgi:allantoinase
VGDGIIHWIVSDHACCARELKIAADRPADIWLARAGFGGTEYLLSGVFSEGRRRGLPGHRLAELLCWNPARRFGLSGKGDIAIGFDADVAVLDPDRRFTVHGVDSPSSQGYTPFEGLELTGHVQATFLRGRLVYEDGRIVGPAQGRYLRRPGDDR